MQLTYRPGFWGLIARNDTVVAVGAEASPDLVAALWARLDEAGTLAAVVDVISESVGGRFSALPSFAAVVREGEDVRVALRGPIRMEASGGDGVETASGENVTTWSERFVPQATRVVLTVPDEAGDARLPLVAGAVKASEAVIEFTPAAAPVALTIAVPEPEPEPEPVPESEPESVPEPEPEPEESAAEHTLVPTEQTFSEDSDEFQQLFGDTIHTAAPSAAVVEDHDGATISIAAARALRGDLPPVPPAPEAPTEVLSAVSTGRIRMSSGQVVALDRTVVIGRRPRAPRASGAELPHLIAVESPQQDISRSHLEIRPEADAVVVVDLHTTNGSTLLRTGADPVRLHPGEPTIVLSGDVVDLGDGVTVAFEELP